MNKIKYVCNKCGVLTYYYQSVSGRACVSRRKIECDGIMVKAKAGGVQ